MIYHVNSSFSLKIWMWSTAISCETVAMCSLGISSIRCWPLLGCNIRRCARDTWYNLYQLLVVVQKSHNIWNVQWNHVILFTTIYSCLFRDAGFVAEVSCFAPARIYRISVYLLLRQNHFVAEPTANLFLDHASASPAKVAVRRLVRQPLDHSM
jgi:hypothetical protein